MANLPAHIINTHFDKSTGWRNTKAGHAALAYIQELEAANTRLEVENGWLTEDNEEIAGKLKETEERLQEEKRRNGVLQELLEERMKVFISSTGDCEWRATKPTHRLTRRRRRVTTKLGRDLMMLTWVLKPRRVKPKKKPNSEEERTGEECLTDPKEVFVYATA